MHSQWISPPGDARRKNLYFRARRKFTLEAVLQGQRLHIAAESYYKLWVNGHAAGEGPARGSRSVNFYDSHDIASFLMVGENHIAVLVQSMNIPNFTTYPVAAALAVELVGLPSTGDLWEVLVNDEWREDVAIFCVQVGFMEYRDMRKTPLGWRTGSDDGQWVSPQVLGSAEKPFRGKTLLPRPVPELEKNCHLPVAIAHAASVTPLDDIDSIGVAEAISQQLQQVDDALAATCCPLTTAGQHDVRIEPDASRDVSVIFHFGREVIGFFELEITAAAGTVIDIGYDEELEAGRLNAMRGIYKMADRYICRDGLQRIGNTIHERGFRFVEVVIRNIRKPISLRSVRAVDRRYPLPRRGSFHSSDQQLNRIWDVCVETMSACTTDVFTDCPWRERAFWVNDLIVENIVSLAAFGDYRLNAHALRLAFSNIRDDGMLPGVCPDKDSDRLVLVATNLLVALMLKDYALYSGDMRLVEELLPVMEAILDRFNAWRDADGLLIPPKKYWNFFDWSYGLNGIDLDGKNTSLLNWLYCSARNTAAWLGEALGRTDMERHRVAAASVAASIEKRFWKAKEQRYADWLNDDCSPSDESSQLAHALALLSGNISRERTASAAAALDDERLLTPELYLHCFVFEAMQQTGMHTQALARIRRYWGKMIESGTPTLWEVAVHQHGKNAMWNAGSLCHGFGASPAHYFQTAVLGIRPLLPGFKEFSLAPEPHDLEFAAGRIPTPSGVITIEWRRDGEKLLIDVDIPHGCTAVTAAGKLPAGHHCYTPGSGRKGRIQAEPGG